MFTEFHNLFQPSSKDEMIDAYLIVCGIRIPFTKHRIPKWKLEWLAVLEAGKPFSFTTILSRMFDRLAESFYSFRHRK